MSKPKLLCIIGRTCSGKDTMAKVLAEKFNIQPLVSYTTRPKRDSETEGVEHYFITEKEYEERFNDVQLLAYTEINGYKYFTTYDQLLREPDKLRSYIIDPKGYYDLLDLYHSTNRIDILTMYVECPKFYRKSRYESREGNISIPFETREAAESKQFDNFEIYKWDRCDFVINTINTDLRKLLNPGGI